ncbi:MAG: hypothetical protein QM731_01375 [Chitinophagaceae bacterium]
MRNFSYLVICCWIVFAGCSKDGDETDDGGNGGYAKGSFGGVAFSFPDNTASYMGGFLNVNTMFYSHPDSLHFSLEVHTDDLNTEVPMGDTYYTGHASAQVGVSSSATYHSWYTDCTGGASVEKYSTGLVKLHREGNYITGVYNGTVFLTTSCLVNDTKSLNISFKVKLDE